MVGQDEEVGLLLAEFGRESERGLKGGGGRVAGPLRHQLFDLRPGPRGRAEQARLLAGQQEAGHRRGLVAKERLQILARAALGAGVVLHRAHGK